MRLVIEISVDGAAFVSNLDGELETIMAKLLKGGFGNVQYFGTLYPILDSNGNTVGFFKWEV